MADPIQISCINACTVTVVHELSLAPLQLTPVQGFEIASSILVVWAVAYGFRACIRALNVDRNNPPESES